VPDREYHKRVCRTVSQRDKDGALPGEDWVPLQVPSSLMETIEVYVECDKSTLGLCLLCGCHIESRADFILSTNTHNRPEGVRLHESSRD
jgi:hypothetical protein